MPPTSDSELARAASLLSQLLEDESGSSGNQPSPVVLYRCGRHIDGIEDVRVLSPNDSYPSKPGGDDFRFGHAIIAELLASGYVVMAVFIAVRASITSRSTEHEAQVILAKPKA